MLASVQLMSSPGCTVTGKLVPAPLGSTVDEPVAAFVHAIALAYCASVLALPAAIVSDSV